MRRHRFQFRPARWNVAIDSSEVLQFASFVGMNERFNPDPDATPLSVAEQEWREWWFSLHHSVPDFTQFMRKTLAGDPMKHRDEILRRNRDMRTPPGTEHLGELRQRYQHVFQQERGRLEPAFVNGLPSALDHVNFQKLVQIERARTRSRKPTDLLINFVFWPSSYQVYNPPGYLILGQAFLNEGNLQQLHDVLSTAIRRQLTDA